MVQDRGKSQVTRGATTAETSISLLSGFTAEILKLDLRISGGWGLLVRLKLLDALSKRMDHILCTYSWIVDKLVESFRVEFG